MIDSHQETAALSNRVIELVPASDRLQRDPLPHRRVESRVVCFRRQQPIEGAPPAGGHESESLYDHDFRRRFTWGVAVAVALASLLELLDRIGLLNVPQ